MSVPAYSEYKGSGVVWLGDVPSHWEVKPFRYGIAAIEAGTSVNALDTPAETSEVAVLKTSCVYTGTFRPEENKVVIPEDRDRVSCPVRPGTLIVSRMNTPELVGAAGLVREFVPNLYLPDRLWQLSLTGLDAAYAHYWTQSRSYRGQVEVACAGTSSSMQNLSQGQVCGFKMGFPPISEQAAIAAFLDRETAKIDALVAEQERLIALLKEKRQAVISHAVTKGLNPDAPMKDSGIEWLGRIPAHWKRCPLKRVSLEFCDGPFGSGLKSDHYVDEGALVIRLQNIKETGFSTGEAAFIDLQYFYADLHRHSVSGGDLLIAGLGDDRNLVGRACVAPIDLGVAMVKADCFRFRINDRMAFAPFVAAQLNASASFDAGRLATGTTRSRISLSIMAGRTLALPPTTQEQQLVMRHCAAADSKFRNLIAEAQSAITLLQERRAALISAAVTGKIDVRGSVINAVPASLDHTPSERELPSLRAIIGGHVVLQLGPMGRMAVMKGGYLAEAHCGLSELGGRYERYAAGPYDPSLIVAMERGAFDLCGVKTDATAKDGERVTYSVPKAARVPVQELCALVGAARAQRLSQLLTNLKGLSRDGVEAVATIYAVWNDLLAACSPAGDDAIFTGVLNDWHPEKTKKFRRADLEHWIAWMRRNDLVPDGTAPRTDHQGNLFT